MSETPQLEGPPPARALACFLAVDGRPVRLVSGMLAAERAAEMLAIGFEWRILDGTPFEGAASVRFIPDYAEFEPYYLAAQAGWTVSSAMAGAAVAWTWTSPDGAETVVEMPLGQYPPAPTL